jgi:hypothetical protein
MTSIGWHRRVPVALSRAAVLCAAVGSARASIIETTPTLPLLGAPYTTLGGNCFPHAGFCVADAEFTLTSLASGGFMQNPTSEFITTNATATIDLTSLSDVPLATATLTGVIQQEVLGRLNPSDAGSWTVDLVSVSLSGTLGGDPVTMMLNPDDLALDTGTTSIVPAAGNFSVSSFFDVFTALTYDGPNGLLTATPSGIATATSAPEPATLALLAIPLLGMATVRRRRA